MKMTEEVRQILDAIENICNFAEEAGASLAKVDIINNFINRCDEGEIEINIKDQNDRRTIERTNQCY